jgi:hypothetical protein
VPLSLSLSLFCFLFSFFFLCFFFLARTYDSTKERHASIGRSVDFYPSMYAPFHRLTGTIAPSIGARRTPETRPSPSRPASNRSRVFCPFITKSITEARAKRAASRQGGARAR